MDDPEHIKWCLEEYRFWKDHEETEWKSVEEAVNRLVVEGKIEELKKFQEQHKDKKLDDSFSAHIHIGFSYAQKYWEEWLEHRIKELERER